MEKEKLCLRCMRKIGDNNVCPYCRNEQSEPQEAPYLPLKAVVGGKFLVGKLVHSDGEGNTYYAFDHERKTPVTLREFFPKGLVSRGEDNYCLVNVGKATDFINAKAEFNKLWSKLSTLSGFTAVCPVYDIFEDLGTVYAVTEYLGEGKSLREFLLEKTQGYISWNEAEVLFMPVLTALEEMHKAGVIHGGISPMTLVLDKNGKLRITDCCTKELRTERGMLESELFDGYAAVEQYGFSEGLGEYSDVYGAATTLYRALIGSTPMSAASRLTNDKLMIPGKFAEQLPAYVINALVNALQILPEDRTSSMEIFHAEITASPSAAAASVEIPRTKAAVPENTEPEIQPVEEPEELQDEEEIEADDTRKIKGSTIAAFVISAVLCLGIIIAVIFLVGRSHNKPEPTTLPSDVITDLSDTEVETTLNADIEQVAVPNFQGKVFDDVKNDQQYRFVLSFKTQFVDSDQPRGTIISQDIAAGTVVSAVNPRKITFKVSDGFKVPDVSSMLMEEATTALKSAGFKDVKAVAGKVADRQEDSNRVYSVVYYNAKTSDWAEIPNDRRLSAEEGLIVYYYGEYVETTAETTGEETTRETTTQAPETTEAPETTAAPETETPETQETA